MILKSLFKIKIHLFFYIFMFVSFFTGHFFDYIIFTSILIVHEFGHILGGLFFSWKIERVIVLPFGCLTVFNTLINTSLFEQFIVALLGPLFQIIYFILIDSFFNLPKCVGYYNFVLLFFNLLPIFPLDGSKFLYVVFCLFFPFRYAHILILIVSFIVIFVFVFFLEKFNLIICLIFLFLIIRCINELLSHKNIFNKFLFERYLYDFKFRHVRVVKSVNMMSLWCRHIFSFDKCITERDFLLKKFDKNGHL